MLMMILMIDIGNLCIVVVTQAAEDDVEAKREVLEAVKEPVGCMVEIVQSYKNKHVVSEVFSSSLFRRRQTEADEAVVFAERLVSWVSRGRSVSTRVR